MIGYFDTSAFVPLLVAEPSSPSCRRFWNDADAVISSRLLYVEAAAALAQAHRMRTITQRSHRRALGLLDRFWSELDVLEVEDTVVFDAARLAREHDLRGYDAVHCASAERIAASDLVAASGDRQLLRAWAAVGVATYDPNAG